MRVGWVEWLWCCLGWIRPSTWGGGLRSWTPILWFTLSSLGRNPKRRSSTNSDDYLKTLQRRRLSVPQSLVSSLSHPTFVDHPRRHNLEGVWIRMRSVVISELSARIYKSFSFSGSGSWIWLALCVLSMCAYNSSTVESADSEMIPPFQHFQSHSNPANSAKDPVQQASNCKDRNFNSCASVYGRKSINDTRCSTILLRVSWEWLWISIICRFLICLIVDGRGPVGESWGSSLYIDHKQTFYATHDNLAAKVEHQYLPSFLQSPCVGFCILVV